MHKSMHYDFLLKYSFLRKGRINEILKKIIDVDISNGNNNVGNKS